MWSLTSLEVPGHNGKAERWCMSRDPTATPGPQLRPKKTNMLRASTSPKPHLTFSGEANAHIVLHPVSYLPLTSSTAAFLEHTSCPEREGVHQGTGDIAVFSVLASLHCSCSIIAYEHTTKLILHQKDHSVKHFEDSEEARRRFLSISAAAVPLNPAEIFHLRQLHN